MIDFTNISFKGTFRDYQQRILDNSNIYLSDGKINIVAAPGSGKTILGLELIRRLNNPCIILSPTTTIREQWRQRFGESFLDNDNINDYVSNDLNKIALINTITYQALYSAMNKVEALSDDEKVDYSNIDLFKLMKMNNIKTICLDEAHHLQNEWQKALEKFIKVLEKDVKIISLTATPPYDAKLSEWQRYISLCGEIDEEIFVPELVKQKTLCPHQDYIYFNYPTESEINSFKDYRIRALNSINYIGTLDFIKSLNERINQDYDEILPDIYANVKEYISLLILFNYYEFSIKPKLIRLLTNGNYLPELDLHYAEVAIQFLLDSDTITDENKKVIIDELRKNHLYERNQVYFDLNDSLKRRLVSSIGKIKSIVQIVEHEYSILQNDLRMVILNDYIKKELVNKIGSIHSFDDVSVVSVFESIRRMNIECCILSGSLVILPDSTIEYIKQNYEIKFSSKSLNNTNYSIIEFKGSNKEKVWIVSEIFEKGIVNVLIGTKSLLGEGWDSPCINSLILASFVGSFMLSNQMRGRAIRINKKNPNKVSNIWHLATIEPDYVFENNKFKKIGLYLSLTKNAIKSYDFETLSRRFECFVGPRYDANIIESGMDRISIIHPPYNKNGFDLINEKMLEYSSNRNLVRERWNDALIENSRINIQSCIPKDRKIPSFTFFNIGYLVLLNSIATAIISTTFQIVSRFSADSSMGILTLAICSLFFILYCYGITILIKKLISFFNPKNTIKTFAKCILKTLKDFDIIESACHIKVNDEVNGIYINVNLVGATIHEQNIFNSAIAEFLSPIENPRYIVIKKHLTGRLNYRYSFACPSIIGKSNEIADTFKRYLEKQTGKFSLIYTRSENGRKLILTCRKKSYIAYNAKLINKKHKVSRFE